MAGKNGKKGGGLFWIPRKNHKHKHLKEQHNEKKTAASIGSQKGPTATAAGTAMMTKAMMSGDSPDHCRTDPLLELKDRPVACTSNGNANKPSAETITASVSVEPVPKPQEALPTSEDKPEEPIGKRNRSTSTDDDEIETAAIVGEKKEDGEEQPLANGAVDLIDGDPTKFNNLGAKKLEEDSEDESCGVKCLYYTLQCCECTIM